MGDTATAVGCFRLHAILQELKRWGESDTFDEGKGNIRGYLEMVNGIISPSLKQPLSSAHEQTEPLVLPKKRKRNAERK